jgi:IS5 family transposase
MSRLDTGGRNPTVAEIQGHNAEMNAGDLCEDCVHHMLQEGQLASGRQQSRWRCGGRSYRFALFDADDVRMVMQIMCTGCHHFRVMVPQGPVNRAERRHARLRQQGGH